MYKLCLYKPLIANYSEIHGIFFLFKVRFSYLSTMVYFMWLGTDRSVRVNAVRAAICETFPEPNRRLLQR